MKKFLLSIYNLIKKLIDSNSTPTTPTTPVDPSGLVPKKIAHGAKVSMNPSVHAGEIGYVDGVQLRWLDIDSDSFVTTAGVNAKSVRIKDGKMCADDWVNKFGQVMVFQYWTLGTSDISAKCTDNPVAIKRDSRIWSKTYAPIA